MAGVILVGGEAKTEGDELSRERKSEAVLALRRADGLYSPAQFNCHTGRGPWSRYGRFLLSQVMAAVPSSSRVTLASKVVFAEILTSPIVNPQFTASAAAWEHSSLHIVYAHFEVKLCVQRVTRETLSLRSPVRKFASASAEDVHQFTSVGRL